MSASVFQSNAKAIAHALLGAPNTSLSSRDQLRYGTNGSLSVEVGGAHAGQWFDHEQNVGGGMLDLIRHRNGCDLPQAMEWARGIGVPLDPPKEKPSSGRQGKIVATYDYVDEHGELLFQVVKLDPKDFRQRKPDPASRRGWDWKTKGVRRVPYRLPELLAADAGETVFIVEGEKDVDALRQRGLIATCNPGGAAKAGQKSKWPSEFRAHFDARHVAILPDNDEAGQAHAEAIIQNLAGAAASIRIINLPGLPPKGDVSDWLQAGGQIDHLRSMVENADQIDATTMAKAAEQRSDIDASVKDLIREMNEQYMVVNEAGKTLIYQTDFDSVLQRHCYTRLAFNDLRGLYMNRLVPAGLDDDGKPIYQTAANVWLKHPERRQFIHGVTFDPSGKRAREGVLNLWTGLPVMPRSGDWSLMRAHMLKVLCAGDPDRFNYLLGWIARMLQRPAEQGEVAVVLRGGEGTGKGTLAKTILKLVGHHGLAISNSKHLVGNFNAHLRDCIFLFVDEAFFAGDKAHVGVLKSLITEPYLTVEAKYANAVQSGNFLHIMMASNEEWVVPASQDARRYFVLEVPDTVKGNHTYFAAIQEQMDAGGYEAMLHDLLALDLSHFNVRAVPVTEGLQSQRKLSLPVPEAWWQDCLDRGYVFRSKLGLEAVFRKWHEEVSTDLLFASYMEFAESRRDRHPLSRETLGRFIKRMGGGPKRLNKAPVGEHIVDEINAYGSSVRKAKPDEHPRPYGYVLGPLDLARDGFADATGIRIDWDGGHLDG